LNLSPPTPLSYFASLVQSDDQFPLLEAAASLAQDEEPALDVQQVLDDVARLVKRVTARMPDDADDLTRLAILTQVFYKDLGFGSTPTITTPLKTVTSTMCCARAGAFRFLWP
jgi:regulator of sirC expression with transglutaminase-like and TPR domain